jgi:hypothetical protein
MAEVQQLPAKPSLIELVFGSRIAQAVGIFGVAFTLFQGLESFIRFSRFMAYLVHHWRELTRAFWSWIASVFSLDLPAWILDSITLALFVLLFTIRAMRSAASEKEFYSKRIIRFADWLIDSSPLGLAFLAMFVVIILQIIVIPAAIFLTLHVHIGALGASIASMAFATIYGFATVVLAGGIADENLNPYGIYKNSERAILVLIGLLGMNYLAHHSHALEAFIETAIR